MSVPREIQESAAEWRRFARMRPSEARALAVQEYLGARSTPVNLDRSFVLALCRWANTGSPCGGALAAL